MTCTYSLFIKALALNSNKLCLDRQKVTFLKYIEFYIHILGKLLKAFQNLY